MSIPLNLFSSCFVDPGTGALKNRHEAGCTYPFGIDPVWGVAKNKLSMYNSLKMKTSVIFGIGQMMMGLFLRGLNAIDNISFIDFFFEFVP